MKPVKTTITLDKETVFTFSKVAREKGFSMTKVASDALKLATEALSNGESIENIKEVWKIHNILYVFDNFFIPASLLLEILKDREIDDLIVLFYDHGKELGTAFVKELGSQIITKYPTLLKILLPIRKIRCDSISDKTRIIAYVPPRVSNLGKIVGAYLRGFFDGIEVKPHKLSIEGNVIEVILDNIDTELEIER